MSELHANIVSNGDFGAEREGRMPQEDFRLDYPVNFMARIRTFGELNAVRFFAEIQRLGETDEDDGVTAELRILHTYPSKDVITELRFSNSFWSPISNKEPELPPIGAVAVRAMNGYLMEPSEEDEVALDMLLTHREGSVTPYNEWRHGNMRAGWGLTMNPDIRPHFNPDHGNNSCT